MSWPAAITAFVLSLAIELIAVASPASPVSRAVQIRQISHIGSTTTLEITLPTPRFDTASDGKIQLIPLREQRVNGDVLAPVVLGILAEPGASVQIQSIERGEERVGRFNPSSTNTQDIADDGKAGPTRVVAEPGAVHLGIGYASIEYRGRLRARGVSGLVLGVYDLAGSSLHYARKITLKIVDPKAPYSASSITDLEEPYHVSAAAFKARLSASKPTGLRIASTGDLQQVEGIQAADGMVYRMNVRDEGIYHLTFEDIRKFGIDPGAIDLPSLRVINHGQQVPIFVFDHHDGHFDNGDYFEFFGEAKKYEGPGTFGDFRYDPDTKDNVYYLVWGTRSPLPAGGLQRIVEESGEIRTADRSKYTDLSTSSFPATIHTEQFNPNANDNLEVSDINKRSDLRDHNFMAILGAGDSYTFSTVVPFADVRSNRPLTLRVALHGLSHDDPNTIDAKGLGVADVPNEHEVEVSLNNRIVLHHIWDSQEMRFLSTDTVSQRVGPPPTTALLARAPAKDGEIDPLNITFWNRKDPNLLPAFVRFGINWFDLEYDRLYVAYQDELTFHAPKYSPVGLYQFTLRGFSRSDISIYRKGVSRITNAVYSENPNIPGSAKTVFQINVSSDADEFIAVTENKKLKPYSYSRDDYANLRDVSNRGAYLIITNSDHLPKGHGGNRVPLEDLLDHRVRTQGVTAKIIDVRNIYDEFRSGARSANAIQDFLKYAYDNWADPPKYVMLVGVTHPGDGDPQPFLPNDQVPAPYIQAFKEGTVAADPWYGMVDGDDMIPDIAIGRLPTGSIDEDRVYVDKAIAHDNDPTTPGDWKNRLFFISIGIQFTDQANLLLVNNVPHRVSVGRMQTHKGEPYYGTDQTLVDKINDGLNSVIYLGHGGNQVWADPVDTVNRPVLLPSDMPRLHNNGRFPIILSLTCFTAGYDHMDEGLLRSFMLAKSAGAVAGFGTTAFGWAENDYRMGAAILPHVYDSVGGTYAERIDAGKAEYVLRYAAGDLLPSTLVYCYHYIGDPMVSPLPMKEHVSLTLGSRNLKPGGQVQISGTTTIQNGEARIELVDPYYSPLVPNHVSTVQVTGGSFSLTDNIPNTTIDAGAYRVVVTSPTSKEYAATTADVTFNVDRVTEVEYTPRPVSSSDNLVLSASVQAVQPITSVTSVVDIYSTDAAGVVTHQPTLTLPMTLTAGRYVGTLPNSSFSAGDRIESSVRLDLTSSTVYSDTVSITVGAAADPSVWKDVNHPTLIGKYRMSSSGLVWNSTLYNWGASGAVNSIVSLLDLSTGSAVVLGSATTQNIASHSFANVDIPVQSTTLDSALFVLAVRPADGSTSRSLRDSLLTNDSTRFLFIEPAAVGYTKALGTSLDGVTSASGTFNSGEVTIALPAGALGNVDRSVIRLGRAYAPITTTQPDIHFVHLRSNGNRTYTTLRAVDDSLGAVPLYSSQAGTATLTLTLDPSDSVLRSSDSVFIYRLDDRATLWTKLATSRRAQDKVTATITNLGTFAVASNSDRTPPVVDLAVEGQIFSNNGEVPPQPHIQCVIQDANGIDITPGKTVVKIDNRVLQPSEYVVLDSGRTTTTVNMRMEPELATGTHTISVQATDDNGNVNTPPKEISVHVSNEFGVSTLGSYPNPFTRDYMFIAYEIRGIAYADEVALDIYTVSGRKIRTLSFPNDDPSRSSGFLKGGTGMPTSLGYHEVWWDGRDNNLDEVANGPYYYVLRVKTRDAVREVKGKFARVR